VIKKNAADILGRGDVQNLLTNVKKFNESLVTDLVPDMLTEADVHLVLQNLLREKVCIRDMVSILEALSYHARVNKDTDYLTEQVRMALSRSICKQHQNPDTGELPVVTLDPAVEEQIAQGLTPDGQMLALGPVFVVLALFKGTRGLFTGWLKGVVLLALAPLFAVLGGSLMLDLAVPVLSTLAATPGQIDPQAAMAFFMVAAVHAALMLLVLRVSATMVAGWSVFGLANKAPRERADPASVPRLQPAAAPGTVAAVDRAHASAPQRSIRLSPSGQIAANDTGIAALANREVRLVNAGAASAASAHMKSRAQGIGSRFRAAPDKRWEKLK